MTYSSSLSASLSSGSSTSSSSSFFLLRVLRVDIVMCVWVLSVWEREGFAGRRERGEEERERRDRGRRRESDTTWLPGWASRCNTQSERAAGRPFGASAQRSVAVGIALRKASCCSLSSDAGDREENGCDDAAETTHWLGNRADGLVDS